MSWLDNIMARWRKAVFQEQPRAVDLMHWSAQRDGYPYCGARLGSLWTIEFDSVTCKTCKEQGLPVVLQYWTGNR